MAKKKKSRAGFPIEIHLAAGDRVKVKPGDKNYEAVRKLIIELAVPYIKKERSARVQAERERQAAANKAAKKKYV